MQLDDLEDYWEFNYLYKQMATKQNFKDSYKRLQEISDILDKEEVIDVDQLIKLQEEAKKLYTFCNAKLKELDEKLDSKQDI